MTCAAQQAAGRGRWPRLLFALTAVLLGSVWGCRCGGLEDSEHGRSFTRCTQVDPPPAGSFQSGSLVLTVRDRTLEIAPKRPLQIAAFTGPVGAALSDDDVKRLQAARPELALYLGGLGDTAEVAKHNITRIAATKIPTLFIAGGADRLPVIEAAFAALPESARAFVIHGSGLRELTIGRDRFVIVAGAPFGRYALDAQACGFGARDLAAIREDLSSSPSTSSAHSSQRVWLLSWHAPAGQGVAEGYGNTELGSPDLQALALTVHARGGIFAYPEVFAGELQLEPFALVVPRLGRVGTERADGSRLPSGVASLVLGESGLVLGLVPPRDRIDGPARPEGAHR